MPQVPYLPEMDDYYNSTEQMLNLSSTDDNPLSYIWGSFKAEWVTFVYQIRIALTVIKPIGPWVFADFARSRKWD